MAKARNPITLGEELGIPSKQLVRLGVLDVTLAIDTKLFIDPLLLEFSRHPEMSKDAVLTYREHFEKIIKLLKASSAKGDVPWRSAIRMLSFPEVRGTCLGYGAASIHGSGFGPKLTARLAQVASEIVQIGVDDPDLFAAMALFESDIGPDRISDMVTNVILDPLAAFNARILRQLKLTGAHFTVRGKRYTFLENTYEPTPTPVILLPTDVLRDLPIANDWDSVAAAAAQANELREKVNEHVAEIWAKKTKRDKARLKAQALQDKASFETLLESLRAVGGAAYDVSADPDGLLVWAIRGAEYAKSHPLKIAKPAKLDLTELHRIVGEIVEKFRHLIEHSGLNKELYRTDGKARHESSAQRLFFAVAYSYCEANDIDVSPEIDTGNGKVDFKFSTGFKGRVLVEIKLSKNQNLVAGYFGQLDEYRAAQKTLRAYYIVVDVGRMGNKDKRLIAERNKARKSGKPLSELEFVDGKHKTAPSKVRK